MAYSTDNNISSSSNAANEVSIDVFKYTTGDTFTFEGADYEGYYAISNNIAYKGRVVKVDSETISKKDNVKGNYISSRDTFKRGTTTDTPLTYDLEALQFQPSEFINQNSLNVKFEKLYDNFLDLYNLCFIRNSKLPNEYTGFFAVTGAQPFLNYTTDLNSAYDSTSNIDLADTKGFDLIGSRIIADNPLEVATPGQFLTIYHTTSSVHIYRMDNTPGEDSTATFIVSTNRADGPFSQLFQNITDITTNDRDTLYISDAFHDQIYRLYIDPIINESRVNQNSFDLINAGGFKLNTAGSGVLSGANNIYYYNNEIFTWNEGRKTIIVLDNNLAKNRVYRSKFFAEKSVVDFAVNSLNGILYILFSDFTFLEVDSSFRSSSKLRTPNITVEAGEVPSRIIFSQNDSGIYYIASNINIYKFANLTGADETIGKFNFTDIPGVEFNGVDHKIFDIKILAENDNRDSLFIYDKDTTTIGDAFAGEDRLLRFNESNNLVTVLKDDSFKIYDKNDIFVTEQYFNNITFNKSLQKLIFNHDNLVSNIHFDFNFLYDTEGRLAFTTLTNLSSNNIHAIDYNNFVGVNETLTPQAFNRCMERIYSYQQQIQSLLQYKVINLKYPYNEIVTF